MKVIALLGGVFCLIACGGASDPGDEESAGSGGSGAVGHGGTSGSPATGGTASGSGGTGIGGSAAGGSGGSDSQAGRGGVGGKGGVGGAAAGRAGSAAGGRDGSGGVGGAAAGSAGSISSGGSGGVSGGGGEGGSAGEAECPPQRPTPQSSCDHELTCLYHSITGCYCLNATCTDVSPECQPGAGGASSGAFAPPADTGGTGAGDRVPIGGASGIPRPQPPGIPCSCLDGSWFCAVS